MNGCSRFVVTLTDGKIFACILFTKDTSHRLFRTCRAFAFDGRIRCRVNRTSLRGDIFSLLEKDPVNEGLRQLVLFLSAIPTNVYFAVCPGDISGSRLLLQITENLGKRNNYPPIPQREEKIRALANYNFTSHGKIVRKAGPAGRSQRKCRFCGRSIPDTTFFSKAHTVSEALGNKTLYTNDECDSCNSVFARTIEPEFINRISPFFPLLNIAGKNGGRKVRDKYYSLFREEKFNSSKRIILKINDKIMSATVGGAITDIEMRTESSARAWVPHNIYRSLCKFVIGTLDTRLLRYFHKTVEWINGRDFASPLPQVCMEHLDEAVTQPVIYIYRRKRNRHSDPYIFARVHILSCAYTFIIPFCSLDTEQCSADIWLKKVTGLIPSSHTQWLDLNSHKPIIPEVIACFVSGDHNITSDIDGTSPGCIYPHARFTGPSDMEDIHTTAYIHLNDASCYNYMRVKG